MPCSSGRASHNLCTPSCPTTLDCCAPKNAFSCRQLCPCPELLDNVFLTDTQTRLLTCDHIATLGCTGLFGGTLTFIECLGTTGWPAFGCPVVIGLNTDPITEVGTVVNGVLTPAASSLPDQGTYTVLVDELACFPAITATFSGP